MEGSQFVFIGGRLMDNRPKPGWRTSFTSGCSSMVEPQPSKLVVRVRFPSPAPCWLGLVGRFDRQSGVGCGWLVSGRDGAGLCDPDGMLEGVSEGKAVLGALLFRRLL